MDREQFRLAKVGQMEQVSANLLDPITDLLAQGLTGEQFADALQPHVASEFTAQGNAFALGRGAFAWFWDRIKDGLTAVTKAASPQRIADWLGTAIVNGSATAAAQDGRGKMWLSRRDDKVRPFHIDADGQVVALGDQFTVCDGRKMDFPGQPVGNPDCWINCRCVSAIVPLTVTATGNDWNDVPVEQVTAAVLGDPGEVGRVIVAVPADDDPVWQASSERVPHLTLVWLGVQDFTDETWQAITDAVHVVAGDSPPYTLPVTGREDLGDDKADVAMLDPGPMAAVRDILLERPAVRAAHDAVQQYPQWTPHLTMGYPDTPAVGDPPEQITFDRLALWDGDYTGQEFPMAAATQTEEPLVGEAEVEMDEVSDEMAIETDVPWHGVLAPEGVYSGDGRKFAEGALTWRDLPLPLLWQERSGMGHEGSVVVGQISQVWRDAGLIRATGTFAATEAADQVIGLLADNHLRGVSVDVDNAEMAMEDDEGQHLLFSSGRVSAATVVPIPAFAEAFLALGVDPEHQPPPPEQIDDELPLVAGGPKNPVRPPFVDVPMFSVEQFKDYDTETRKRMAKAGTAMPDGSFPIADEEDLRNAIQSIGRAADPDKARAHIKKRARALGKADLIPEEWADEAVAASAEFKRGPGWVTNPKETKRIHDYWTKPGHEGYAKVAWGSPGDFRRLRAHLAKYIGPQFLNRTAAQWHHDALGYWPGECGRPGNPPCGAHALGTLAASASLFSGEMGTRLCMAEWFTDPHLPGPTALTVTDEGRVYGHLATWGTCHIGIPGTCTEAPHSPSDYAYYRTGVVNTEAGEVRVGQITMETGHAPLSAGARAAAAHYDNTGTVVADVAAGEDEFGIWLAGQMRPGLSAAQVDAMRAAGAVSGDWRAIGGSLDLVAALVVNVPGFPVPRTSLAASGGHQESLVACGVVGKQPAGTRDDLVAAVADEIEARSARRSRAAALLNETKPLRVAALLTSVEV